MEDHITIAAHTSEQFLAGNVQVKNYIKPRGSGGLLGNAIKGT